MKSFTNPSYFPEHIPRHQVVVKAEASASPDLLPPNTASLQHFQFKFHAHPPSSHGSLPCRHPSEPPALTSNHIYRFGSDSSGYNLMAQSSWPPSPTSSHQLPSGAHHTNMIDGHGKYEMRLTQRSSPYEDDYDEVSDLVELPIDSNPNFLRGDTPGTPSVGDASRHIRRRSSKACDQCRKSKCKCERSSPGQPCKSCVMLGTSCTFLGPSRKRGPPKGYIDAIEARLHQTEALLGIMISATSDARAQSLLRDIAKDPLAKEIINRVDKSPYGLKGRKQNVRDGKPRASQASSSESSLSTSQKPNSSKIDLTSTHPSNEWQDQVSAMLQSSSLHDDKSGHSSPDHQRIRSQASAPSLTASYSNGRPTLRVSLSNSTFDENEDASSPGRRQRRRVSYQGQDYTPPNNSAPNSAVSQIHGMSPGHHYGYEHTSRGPYSAISPVSSRRRRWSVSSTDSLSSGSEEELIGAVGQLSLNEDEQVRYHGKASGLHLLGNKERVDGRNKGGIWRFPGARVWPPLPSSGSIALVEEDELARHLPEPAVQEHLLTLYFKYVHPILPVVHKRAFFEAFRAGMDSPSSPESDLASSTSPFNRRRRRVPTLLLFAMYAIAARYSDDMSAPPPTDSSTMWEAGDEYLNQAKVILDGSYAASRPSTCQALLLMGYREVGIGAMAQAWTYIGMAIRMAQDLGMHRSADRWARVDLGGRLFGEWELHERKRIWFTCVIMDKYVSTYIGRPLMIFERDFDTTMPSENDPEELEEWTSPIPKGSDDPPAFPGRIISCFNASAGLSGILSMIVQAIYAVRPVSSRHSESKFLEGQLDKWYIELPEHLRYEPGSSKKPTPLPHVLTLHMQYWCAVLLLHRPFIRQDLYHPKNKNLDDFDAEARAIAEKSYELCASAANHITSIAMAYSEAYPLKRCAVFLCYYIFTASIMHVTSLTVHPNDPQARMGLNKCMDALHMMKVVWPSAARALELLTGSKVNTQEADTPNLQMSGNTDRRKRSAEQPLDDAFDRNLISNASMNEDYLELRPPIYNSQYNHPMYTASGRDIQSNTSTSSHAPYSSSYERWPSEMAFSAPLSTSVLPQLYSTGLVDDRGPSGNHRVQPDQTRTGHNTRFPQYWNDFSTFPQLGPTYGNYHEHAPIPQHQATSSQIYLAPEPYNLYS